MNSENQWDAYAPGWDSDPDARAYADAAFASLEPVLTQSGINLTHALVCDFGCGSGLLTERLVAAGAAVDALDTSPAMLDVVRAKVRDRDWSEVRVHQELADLPEQPAFDLIVCSSVCSFLPDYPGDVKRLVALLRPGRVFVQWDWEATAGDDHGLSRDEVRAALTKALLTRVHVDTAFDVAMGGQRARPLLGWGQTRL